jgi:hypothetical protein
MSICSFPTLLLAAFFFLSVHPCLSQRSKRPPITRSHTNYGIKPPDNPAECIGSLAMLDLLPEEIRYGFDRVGQEIWFHVTDKEWITRLITQESDGIAVDIVSRSTFRCDSESLPDNAVIKGTLLPPIYRKAILAQGMATESGGVRIKIGDLPRALQQEEIEFNLVLVKGKSLCHYNYFYNIPEHRWGLLDMGMYWENPEGKEPLLPDNQGFVKQLTFVIPFEKDKYDYQSADIQPLYDSLKLKHFNVTAVSVRAYASVEGSTERNLMLQQRRAESIVKALQSYQLKGIRQDVTTAENWVEFFQDIAGTPYASFQSQSKAQIKAELRQEAVAAGLEAILRKHRKAVVYLTLEGKTALADQRLASLQRSFQKAIAQKNVRQALEIQRLVYSKIQDKQLPANFMDSLEIPQKIEFGNLLSNRLVFDYRQGNGPFAALDQFNRLQQLSPANANVAYNRCVLQLEVWLLNQLESSPEHLRQEIEELARLKIDKRLIKRLLINFEIIHCEYLMASKEYEQKDDALRFIFDNYTDIRMSETDAVSLAHYFVSYSKERWATDLLREYVRRIDVSEDLLFYYLSLTIIRPTVTHQPDFRVILLNAANVNKARFCQLFDSNQAGGVTFQLLGDEYLKKHFCETCSQ